MKERMVYTCEYCGTDYKNKEDADACEKGHVTPKKILKPKYCSIKNDATGMPGSITILMSDGTEATYRRY